MFTTDSIPVVKPTADDAEYSALWGVAGPAAKRSLWLIHGLSRRWEDFAPILCDLTAWWHVHAYSHRGHGESARTPGAYRVADYVSDLAAAVKEAHKKCVLVGHSLGALVSMGVAAKLPDLVTAVVLLDPPGPHFLAHIDQTPYGTIWPALQKRCGRPDTSAVAKELAELRVTTAHPGEIVRLGDTRDAASLRFVARGLRDLDPEVFDPPLKKHWLDGFDVFGAAKHVKCPALLVVADPARGGMLPPEDSKPLASALPDCTRVDLPGVGHLIHWQDTPATLRLLHAFLGSL
ncbi:MAG: alpha/beta hydrolase [Planctomycetes bacterium]|nr:alpha/beta hydrolase [Planctomycetota bacterium]